MIIQRPLVGEDISALDPVLSKTLMSPEVYLFIGIISFLR